MGSFFASLFVNDDKLNCKSLIDNKLTVSMLQFQGVCLIYLKVIKRFKIYHLQMNLNVVSATDDVDGFGFKRYNKELLECVVSL